MHEFTYLAGVLHESLEGFLAANLLEVALPEGQHSVHMGLVLDSQLHCPVYVYQMQLVESSIACDSNLSQLKRVMLSSIAL